LGLFCHRSAQLFERNIINELRGHKQYIDLILFNIIDLLRFNLSKSLLNTFIRRNIQSYGIFTVY